MALIPLSVLMLTASQMTSSAPSPAASPAAQARPELAAELERGVRAYNAQDISYYQSAFAPDAVYIADDGGMFVGKERVVGLFGRIFARAQKPRLEVTDVVTGGRGDVGWARFKWTLSDIERARPGVGTVIFVKSGDQWQVASIQNTLSGHAMRAASPAPGASPMGGPRPSASPSPAAHQH